MRVLHSSVPIWSSKIFVLGILISAVCMKLLMKVMKLFLKNGAKVWVNVLLIMRRAANGIQKLHFIVKVNLIFSMKLLAFKTSTNAVKI